MSSPSLSKAIAACPSQTPKARLPKYVYPDEVLSVSDLQTKARGDKVFTLRREEAKLIHDLDLHPKKGGLFGDHLLMLRRRH